MAKVTNLRIERQASEGGLVAKWDFPTEKKVTTSSGKIKAGDWVTIKSGAKWYNGVAIDSWVFGEEWQVYQVSGTRAVLNKNRRGTNHIMSPINVAYLNGGTGSSSSSSTTVSTNTLDHYSYQWLYDAGDSVWYIGTDYTDTDSQETSQRYCSYTPPENCTRVRCRVKPVAKTRKVNNKDTPYWSGQAVAVDFNMNSFPPEEPPSPSVEIEKYELTATIDNITDARTDEIQFQVYDLTKLFTTGTAKVTAAMATFKCNVNAGGSYRVRARAINLLSGNSKIYSGWTDFTSPAETIPSAPGSITTIRGESSTSIYLEWEAVNSAETYEIEYTTNVNYFDGSSETTSVTGIEFNHYTVTGLESGDEYFFRVRAVNDQGESGWTEIKSVVIGKPPSAPTTWSSATTVITGQTLNLYWVHNAQDGSKETYAEVEITVNNGEPQTYTIENPTADDDEAEEKTKYYTVDTSQYTEGTQLKWRVRTAGATKQYGEWSIMRTVDIYAPPTLTLSVTNQNGDVITTLTSFPFFVEGLAGPNTQEPIGYHVSVIADTGYETVDEIGRTKIVNAGEEVFSQYVDTNDPLLLAMEPSNIDLENNISYTVSVRVSMNSGLTADAETSFTVSWTDTEIPLDAEIAIDRDTFTAYVTPYSRDDETGVLTEGYTLAVYRREFDGDFKLIAGNLDSAKYTVVTDPHPALDYARYRIVATSNSTGSVSFYDVPGYPFGELVPVVIQWDEEWTDFEMTDTDERAQPVWNGSLLKLWYNIDVNDNNAPDVVLVNYVGRKYPVSYYGTMQSSTPSWSVEIPATDTETIYQLRRLQTWPGDCYVREPSGSGFWASIKVSFSKTHQELTIPVTLDITRVEGGI